jgi:hypothetical protein
VLDDNLAQPQYHTAIFRTGHAGRFQPDAAAGEATPKFAPGVGLILALVLSLGLWGLVWLTASALVAAWPW